MAARSTPAVEFVGNPEALEAIVPIPSAVRTSIQLLPKKGDYQWDDASVVTAPVNRDSTLVRIVVSATTAPGRYPVRIGSESGEFDCVLDVAPRTQVSVVPSRLELACDADGTADLNLNILNTGNTTVSVRKAYAFGLLERDAVETGIRQAWEIREVPRDRTRADAAGDEIADHYGGLARLVLSVPGSVVEPGTTGHATGQLRLDTKRAKPGRKYRGVLHIEGTSVGVLVGTARVPTSRREEAG